MNLPETKLNEIEELAELFFSPAEIATIIEVDPGEFVQDVAYGFGKISNAFNKGFLLGEAKIRKSVKELAENGSSPAQTLMLQLKKNSEHRKNIENA